MIKIGLIGLGFMGKTHLEAYKKVENAQVVAVCTSKDNYDALLTRKDIDIIDICLPTYLHEEYIIKAVSAGKHLFCEKPLTLTMESAYRIMKAIKENGVKLFVGHVLRFWPEYKEIKSYSERLKGFETIHAKRLGQVPTWSDWFQHPEKSGGALFDLHIHDIDFVYYLLGKVYTVYAVGHKNKFGAWDHVMTTLSFKNGSKAYVEASQRMPAGYPFTMSLRAQTAQSTLDFHISAGENIEGIEQGNNQFVFYSNQSKVTVKVDAEDAFVNQLSYFVNCVKKNEENEVIPLDDVLYSLNLLKAIEKSLEEGRVVKI